MTYPFKQNKYTRWYLCIIDARRRRPVADDIYGERHHVVPKSLGGTNEESNLVKLLAREHFVCHRLLVKMTEGKDKARMVHAAHCMIKCNRRKVPNRITSRAYEQLRKEFAMAISLFHKGRVFSEQHRKAIAKSRIGKSHTPEWKAKVSTKLKGYDFGPAHAARTIAVHTGKKRSDETRAKIKQKRDAQVMPLKEWHLLKPDGTLIKTLRLKEFCQANKLGLSKLRETMVTKQPVDTGYSAGWMIIGFEKLTTCLSNANHARLR